MIYLVNQRPSATASLLADLDPLFRRAPKLDASSILGEVLDSAWAPLLAGARPARAGGARASGGLSMRLDGEANEYVVEGATPGIKRDELRVELVGGRTLEVSFEQQRGGKPREAIEGGKAAAAAADKEGDEHEGNKEGKDAADCSRSGFLSVSVPRDADAAKARVEYADGLLRIAFPRTQGVDHFEERLRIEGGGHADLVAEVGSKRKRVEELREQLEAERQEVERAEKRLREVRTETARRIAAERRPLAIQ